ncbi:MAG: sigma-70 family RNA polymerase sigma factor [Sphingobacteriaceae bacterium]|nr:sigma-70 family RNA polymerase sigma factor [Sphingobacteriaceae bacterium]
MPKDITSTVFIKALSNISKYKDMGFPFSSWLYRIAINEINMFYRKTKKERIISLNEHGLKNMASESTEVDDGLIATLKKSLLHLSPEDLNLIELRFSRTVLCRNGRYIRNKRSQRKNQNVQSLG